MFRFALAGLATAEAGTLAVTYSDCGAKHATVTDLQPTSIHTGRTETITGTGTCDEDVTSAHFTATVSALGAQLSSCSGDGTTDIVCGLPMGMGKITVKALSFPIAKGSVSIPVEVQTSFLIPPSLANVDVHVEATEQNGESVICLDVHTAKALNSREDFPLFADWAATWGKVYNGAEEDARREQIYNANVEWIVANNQDNTMGPTQFMDMTHEEFAEMMYTLQPAQKSDVTPHLGRFTATGEDLPDTIDWVDQGAVSPVKNQGTCGSCWAFSTVGSLEGRAQIATGNLQQFSEQQFVDCDTDFGDMGCKGGLMDQAFTYLMQSKGACTEDSYAYAGKAGTCQIDTCDIGLQASAVTGYQDVDQDITALKEALSHGPVSVAVCAMTVFQFYFGGIVSTNLCGAALDHGVLAVGYGSENGKNYWKVKNSWGANWGEQGYIRLDADKGGKGQCGILSGPPSYPVISAGSVTV